MASEKPILMSGPLVRAILAGQKTQTRRIVKAPVGDYGVRPFAWDRHGHVYEWKLGPMEFPTGDGGPLIRCPYGAPGDALWVREAWRLSTFTPAYFGEPAELGTIVRGAIPTSRPPGQVAVYRASDPDPNEGPWRPGIHMPRWASRLSLVVESVRVERAQDISDEDVAAEGVNAESVEALWDGATVKARREAGLPDADLSASRLAAIYGPRDLWRIAWTLINGRASWEANPWVWVIGFRRVEARVLAQVGGGR